MANDKEQETVYNTKKLSKYFAIVSIVLLIAMFWTVLQDYDRPWKNYQRQAQRIAAAVGEGRLKIAQKAMDQSKLKSLESKLSKLQSDQSQALAEMDKEVSRVDKVYYKANMKFQAEKAFLDELSFVVEKTTKKDIKNAPAKKAQYDQLAVQVAKLKELADTAMANLNEAKKKRKDLLSEQKKTEDEIFNLTKDIENLKKTIRSNEQSIGNLARNAPLVDFVTPTVKINQVILPYLKDDYFFNKVPRVDRCMTCHVTVDKVGFEDFPQPYKTHPKLELMVGVDSAHPAARFGCTTCHSGVPQSVDFTMTAHSPSSEAQAVEWEEKYHWHESHHIKTHMVPLPMVEGKCIQCHAQQVQLDGAETLNAGLRLVERLGCYKCHKFQGHFEDLDQEKEHGPSLKMAASKFDKEWMKKWLWDPKSYRPTTLMPAFWQLHNNSDPASLERGAVEVEAITEYVFSKSKEFTPLQLTSNIQGDVDRGKKLFGEVGCLACHANADFEAGEIAKGELGWKDPRIPNAGPELNQMGSKVTQEWLYSWVKDPKHYWEGTLMPSLKLSEQEAMDIASYLMTKRNQAFEAASAPVANPKKRDEVVMSYLEKKMLPKDASVKLASMSLEDKQHFIGSRLVSYYGCTACHAIEGHDNEANIGAELTYEGSKDTSKFDYGNVHISHANRAEWIFSKIRTPRVFDVGKNRGFDAKTRMPQFNITHEQAEAIAAVVIGHENKNVDDEAIFPVDGRMEKIIAGHKLINRMNCTSCHAIENKAGYVLSHYTDDSSAGPPNLNTEGQKLQPDWFYDYLMNPDVMIRPWVKIRMPQFHMSTEDATVLTKYFAAFDEAPYPFLATPAQPLSSSEFAEAKRLVEENCLSCHAPVSPGGDVEAAAPHFANVRYRLRPDWIPGWVKDPQKIMPGTRMPQLWLPENPEDPKSKIFAIPGYFGDDPEKQMLKVRDYLFAISEKAELPSPRNEKKKKEETSLGAGAE